LTPPSPEATLGRRVEPRENPGFIRRGLRRARLQQAGQAQPYYLDRIVLVDATLQGNPALPLSTAGLTGFARTPSRAQGASSRWPPPPSRARRI
jgi:hypothetical protein